MTFLKIDCWRDWPPHTGAARASEMRRASQPRQQRHWLYELSHFVAASGDFCLFICLFWGAFGVVVVVQFLVPTMYTCLSVDQDWVHNDFSTWLLQV
eukprot:5769772-Amphidinium_carterae.1